MKPSELAARLRRMASAIESSKQPSRVLVARDLRRVLANMSEPVKVYESYGEGDADFSGAIVDIQSATQKMTGPVWWMQTGFGWIMTTADPATLTPESPVVPVSANLQKPPMSWADWQANERYSDEASLGGSWSAAPSASAVFGSENFVQSVVFSAEDAQQLAEGAAEAGLSQLEKVVTGLLQKNAWG